MSPKGYVEGLEPQGRTDGTPAVLAGMAPPSHIPRPGRMLLLHARAVARRELDTGYRTSGFRCAPTIRMTTADRRPRQRRVPSRPDSGRSPRLGAVAPRPRQAACAHPPERGTPPGSPRRDRRRSDRLEDGTLIPSCANSIGGSPYSSRTSASPLVCEENHSASRTLTTNEPSVTSASPEPRFSRRASVTHRFLQPKRRLRAMRERALACRVRGPESGPSVCKVGPSGEARYALSKDRAICMDAGVRRRRLSSVAAASLRWGTRGSSSKLGAPITRKAAIDAAFRDSRSCFRRMTVAR